MVIGISGKIGSGKTTLANYLVNRSDGRMKKMSFASLLKNLTSQLVGCLVPDLADQEFKNKYLDDWGMTVGEFLQWFGTDVCRAKNPNIWVNRLLEQVNGSDTVIDDVRFMNEGMAIINTGGVIIRLNGDPKGIKAASNRDPNHISETDMDNFAGTRLRIDTDKNISGWYLFKEN